MDQIAQALADEKRLDALIAFLSPWPVPSSPPSSQNQNSQHQTITFLLNAVRVSRTQFGEASLRRRASSSFSAPSLSPRSMSVPDAGVTTEEWPALSTTSTSTSIATGVAKPPATELATSMIKKKKKKEKRRIRPQLNTASSLSAIPSQQAHSAFAVPSPTRTAAPSRTITDMVKDVKLVEEELKEENRDTLRKTLFDDSQMNQPPQPPRPPPGFSPRSPNPNPPPLKIALPQSTHSKPHPSINHLARIYSAVILNRLAPSTINEITLLVNLLSVPPIATVTSPDPQYSVVTEVLNTPQNCRLFAQSTLLALTPLLKTLFFPTLKRLSQLPQIASSASRTDTPLSTQLTSLLDAADLTTPNVDDVAQAPLPVQFDKDRDSRHNYKSRELSAVYKNRETTRDAFLSMLRDFKTSGFTNHAVTVDSSHLITQLTEYGNLDWFSDFFVLTVTHMGEGEVDEEVKRLGAEKVGKLARRFNAPAATSTPTQANTEVSQFFLNNLEFFYLFLSCPFSALLTPFLLPRFLFELHSILKDSNQSLVSRIRRATVCAKFVGLLIKGKGGKGEGVNVKEWAESSKPPIDLKAHLVSAYVNNSLVITLPYASQILKLLHHSPLYSTSRDVQDCLKLLGEIGRDHAQQVRSSSPSCNSNSMFIICEIEGVLTSYGRSMLYSSSSPPILQTLSSSSSSLPLYPNNQNLDKQPQHFPLRFLTSSFPTLLALHTCIDDLIRNSERITGGRRTSKKMRPLMVGLNQNVGGNNWTTTGGSTTTTPNPISLTRNPSTDSLNGIVGTPHFNLSDQLGLIVAQSPIGASPGESTPNKQGVSPTKFASHANLVSHFFHLHPALLPICSFITSSVIKKVCADVVDQIIVPVVKECLEPITVENRDPLNPAHNRFDLRSHQKCLETIVTKANQQMTTLLASTPPLIKHLLDLLSPPSPEGVLTECVAICTDFVRREGDGVLKGVVRKEGRAKMETFQWPAQNVNRFDGLEAPSFAAPALGLNPEPATPLEIYLAQVVNNEEDISVPDIHVDDPSPSPNSAPAPIIHHLTHLFKRFFQSVERSNTNTKIESPPPPHFFFVMSIALSLTDTTTIWEKSLTQEYVLATLNMCENEIDAKEIVDIYCNFVVRRTSAHKIAGVRNLVSSLVHAVSVKVPWADVVSSAVAASPLHNDMLLARLKGALRLIKNE
ncbi:hypothetical protein TrST_g416 [Triparma strigata]|uniref:Uncharacterized protein n=1 Tax=Triparma strigata TaxID=1606541 RepID=A0A9W7BUE6_9STRA|nr:hypothetical protein TrST_g416 [Triparma strigata]